MPMKFLNRKILSNFFLIILFTAELFFSSCNKEVSVSPPDAPPPSGFVFINSYPTGFHIYLNSKATRRATPDSLTWLTTGSYLVTLKKDLFTDYSFTVKIVEGEKKSVFIDFSKNSFQLGNIYCTSKPGNAEIFLNDSITGHFTPYTLRMILPGEYKIRYQLKNCRDAVLSVTVSSNNTSNSQAVLVDTTLWQDYTTGTSGIPTNNLTCVAVDKNNVIWLGTNGAGFISYNGTNWQSYTQGNSLLPNNSVSTIAVDNNNLKFVGTVAGFVTFDGSNMGFYGRLAAPLPDFNVEAFAFDKENNWYIGTHGGLTKKDVAGIWTNYNSESVPDKIITALTVDNNDNLWVGMKNSGIARKTPSDLWVTFNQAGYKIISDNITALAASLSGQIWAGFDQNSVFGSGLSYFDGASWNNVYPIPASSKTNAVFIDSKNNKWVATDQGLVKFSSPSSPTLFNYDNTGLNISNVTGIAEDSFGNIWITTSTGLYEYKGNH